VRRAPQEERALDDDRRGDEDLLGEHVGRLDPVLRAELDEVHLAGPGRDVEELAGCDRRGLELIAARQALLEVVRLAARGVEAGDQAAVGGVEPVVVRVRSRSNFSTIRRRPWKTLSRSADP
jgi:hypothetical protein